MRISDQHLQTEATLEHWYHLIGPPQLILGPHQPWQEHAACRNADPDIFFDPVADSPAILEALGWCGRCPVRQACKKEADNANLTGVWGGYFRAGEPRRYARLCGWPGCLAQIWGPWFRCAPHRRGATVQQRARRHVRTAPASVPAAT